MLSSATVEKIEVHTNLVWNGSSQTNKGKVEGRGKYNNAKSIRKRDKSVYRREEAGHWEADAVLSGLGKSTVCFATLAERRTRFYVAVKIPNRKAETMENVQVSILSQFPPALDKTITCDKG